MQDRIYEFTALILCFFLPVFLQGAYTLKTLIIEFSPAVHEKPIIGQVKNFNLQIDQGRRLKSLHPILKMVGRSNYAYALRVGNKTSYRSFSTGHAREIFLLTRSTEEWQEDWIDTPASTRHSPIASSCTGIQLPVKFIFEQVERKF